MKQSLVLPLGKEMLSLAATALAFAFHGGDKARGRAVADEVGGSVTWRDSHRQPVRVRGEALWISPARKIGKVAGGTARAPPPSLAGTPPSTR